MAVVVFNPDASKIAFPEFATVPDARLQLLFNMIGYTLLDNTDGSIVTDPDQRSAMLDLLLAHVLTLQGWVGTDGTVVPGTGTVGRVASASEGTVSTSLDYHLSASAGEAWFNQTPWGAMYWMMSARFLSFHDVAAGRSGIGQSLDYLSRGIGPQVRLSNNSGTPDGV